MTDEKHPPDWRCLCDACCPPGGGSFDRNGSTLVGGAALILSASIARGHSVTLEKFLQLATDAYNEPANHEIALLTLGECLREDLASAQRRLERIKEQMNARKRVRARARDTSKH